jgi:hypothetical protein
VGRGERHRVVEQVEQGCLQGSRVADGRPGCGVDVEDVVRCPAGGALYRSLDHHCHGHVVSCEFVLVSGEFDQFTDDSPPHRPAPATGRGSWPGFSGDGASGAFAADEQVDVRAEAGERGA